MRLRPAIIAILVLVLTACASTPQTNEDPRLQVDAALATPGRTGSSTALFVVRIRNVSDRILKIRRVEVDPIGGGRIRPASVGSSKLLEPGEPVEFEIWTEADARETVIGVGEKLARIIVSFDDDLEHVMGSYLVTLQ